MCALTPHVEDTLFLPSLRVQAAEPPPATGKSRTLTVFLSHPLSNRPRAHDKEQTTQRESSGSGLQPTRVGDNFEGFHARTAECLWRAEGKESHTPGPGPGEGQGILGKSKQQSRPRP